MAGGADAASERVLEHAQPGDWVFVAHHKSGTTVGRYLATALCTAASRRILTYTYREVPHDDRGRRGYRPRCHLLNKIYNEDATRWLGFVRDGGMLVHFMRSPAAMVASGYLFHLRGSEIHFVSHGRGSAKFSADWAEAYAEHWQRRWQKRGIGEFDEGWDRDPGPLAPLVDRACTAMSGSAAQPNEAAPGWVIAPLWLSPHLTYRQAGRHATFESQPACSSSSVGNATAAARGPRMSL